MERKPMTRMLIQTQLSNYDTKGKFILECDSGWQMVVGRAREMLKLVPDLEIDVMGPIAVKDFVQSQLVTLPSYVNPDMNWNYLYGYYDPSVERRGRLNYIQHEVMPNALATRYDFDMKMLPKIIGLTEHKRYPQYKYDYVYINDPLHLRNFKAMFHLYAGYTPKFVVHSHFIDDPSSPKFPTEASLWLGQVEAAIKADHNFWQCQSALDIFARNADSLLRWDVVNRILDKSTPWDDGYSATEINIPPNVDAIRFDTAKFHEAINGKVVIFIPNRIGGRGRSSDYTNCGKFMFEVLPELARRRTGKGLGLSSDFVVIAGNPSQKFFNHELEAELKDFGFLNLVPDALNREEFKYVALHSDIAVGLYDQDSYGGTAARECIELGCVPLWVDNYEYASIAKEANWPYVARKDMVDLVLMADALIETVKTKKHNGWLPKLQQVIRDRCSYEATTPDALKAMGLLP
jgi:hypothetical protein